MGRRQRLALVLGLSLAAAILLSACGDWEKVGADIAQGQATAEEQVVAQATEIAHGVATAVESYQQERERQGQTPCTLVALPLVVVGVALGIGRHRNQ
jgi:hypothetical protein